VPNLTFLNYLPATNAILNSLSVICLVLGYVAIRKREKALHMKFMLSALTFSFLFLVSYLTYHTFHGDTLYHGEGVIRIVYFFILISHIFLSAVVLPMILTTVYYAAAGNFTKHPKIARITLPLWLYVSVTGVLVYLILYHS
jgi:putative membrane protein